MLRSNVEQLGLLMIRRLGRITMNAFLHTLGTLAVLPYMLLAAAFLLIGDVARTRGLLALIDVVANHANWILRWGIYALPVFLTVLVVAGFIPSLQRIGAAVLFLIAFGSLGVICTLHSTRIGLAEFTFLVPCIAVLGVSAWLFVREGTPAEAGYSARGQE